MCEIYDNDVTVASFVNDKHGVVVLQCMPPKPVITVEELSIRWKPRDT